MVRTLCRAIGFDTMRPDDVNGWHIARIEPDVSRNLPSAGFVIQFGLCDLQGTDDVRAAGLIHCEAGASVMLLRPRLSLGGRNTAMGMRKAVGPCRA